MKIAAIPLPLDGGGRGWGWTRRVNPPPQSSPARDCVVIGKMVKNVMLNLFQHLMESISYETLKRVQGDKK
jgi:hypothetical protein